MSKSAPRRGGPLNPSRRAVLSSLGLASLFASAGCQGRSRTEGDVGSGTADALRTPPSDLYMPAEDEPHERTWMCWPSRRDVWGVELANVQATVSEIALAIAEFEPVTMLAPARQAGRIKNLVGGDVEVVAAPVDDLWARDTLPNFLIGTDDDSLTAAHATFNGWGDKQVFDGDTQLAGIVADLLGIDLYDSGLFGEGGAIEVDGRGTVLAAASCWDNDNRNPGMDHPEIEEAILDMVGADRMIWVDGLAGHDITDGHIDTLARFVNETTILIDRPAFDLPEDPWDRVAARTRQQLEAAVDADGQPYVLTEFVQPADVRDPGDQFLSTYMNYYVCNGAVIAPEFGDQDADNAARDALGALFPGRKIVQLDIDSLAAGGGGIHCATQQQPAAS